MRYESTDINQRLCCPVNITQVALEWGHDDPFKEIEYTLLLLGQEKESSFMFY